LHDLVLTVNLKLRRKGMAVAGRIKEMMEQSSWIRRMFETGAQLKAKHGEDSVCDFSLGNPNLPPPREFQQTLLALVQAEIPQKHGYMPNAGYAEVRKAVAQYIGEEYGVRFKPDNVIMTCGAGGALNVILKTVLNPGEKVLVSTPCFVEYRFYVENHGGRLEFIAGKDDFDLDIQAMEKRIDKDTAAVIINSPNNPSGRVYPEETIKELAAVLKAKEKRLGRSIYLLSDEPYRRIVYDGVAVPSVFSFYKNSISATSFSKDLSIAGERIGFLAIHPRAEDAERLVGGSILSNRILGFVNAPALMQRVVASLLKVTVDVREYQRKRDMLCEGLCGLGYSVRKPEGAFYLFPRAPGGDDLNFVEILSKELILTVPGRGFGLAGYFRIAYCVEDKVIERSLPGFGRAIQKVGKS
jgi:aspartate aminotransferase